MTYEQTPQGKDPELWDLAKRRASFRNHLGTYIVINAFLWVLWFVTGAGIYGRPGIPWPVWPLLGWGIGLFFHYLSAYGSNTSQTVEREYQKLQNQKNKSI